MGGREGKATLKMAASVTTLILGILVAAAVLNRIKEEQGFAVVTTSWIVTAVVYSVGWFMVVALAASPHPGPGGDAARRRAAFGSRSPPCSG